MTKNLDKLNKVESVSAEVGFFENATYPEGKKVAEVAVVQEFGTDKIPPRPFIRNTIHTKREDWVASFRDDIRLNLKNGNGLDLSKPMGRLAMRIVADIQDTIIETSTPPNAPSTIKKKGFNNPLQHTNTMLDAVNWRLKK